MFLRLTLLSSLVLMSLVAISAQEDPIPKIVSGGVLNGKATNLVKPKYPDAAKAVNASGAVNVKVTIGEDGSVLSAEAIAGHPLLRAASVEAALASTFSPTTLSGTAVKVTGIIVYNFVAGPPVMTTTGAGVGEDSAPPSTGGTGSSVKTVATYAPRNSSPQWFLVGANLSVLESNYIAGNMRQTSPLTELPADWSVERGYVDQIFKLVEGGALTGDGSEKPETTTPIANYSEVNAVARSLTNSIESRLSGSAFKIWLFNAGHRVFPATADARFLKTDSRSKAVSEIKTLTDNAPVEIPSSIVDQLKSLADLIEKGSDSRDSAMEIGKQRMEIMRALVRLN